ncbi:amidohydrolase family protein [Halomonas denitrificans]|nr:amidohydrolase family protein [Halomonas denitrificans]
MRTHPIAPSLLSILWTCLLPLLCAAPTDALAEDGVLIRDVRIVDPDAATVSEPRDVAILGGWIVDVEAFDGMAADAYRTVDAGGRWLIPGLAEMHAHVPPVTPPDSGSTIDPTAARHRVDDVLALFLAHGVTTIRGMLGEPGHLVLRRQLADGSRFGPRLITSGPSLNGTSAPTADAARRLVRRQAEAGYDLLKLHPGLLPDTFAALTAAADGLDIPFAGHVSGAVGLDRALAARQWTIDHLDGYAQALVPEDHRARRTEPGFFGMALADALDPGRIPELARATRSAGTWNVPTQTLIENIAVGDPDALVARPAMRYAPAATIDQWRRQVAQLREPFGKDQLQRFVEVRRSLILGLHEAGAGLLLGADAPQIFNVPGDAAHHELELLVAAGLTPAEALATGTTAPARFLDEAAGGCIAPGCVADLVLLDGDPLADIGNVRRIRAVVRAGRWLDRNDLDRRLAAIARRARPDAPTAPD